MSASNNGFNSTNPAGIAEDPSSTNNDVKPVSIFSTDYKKHDDLKQMLDSNKDNLKLDAMKRIIGMIAKGKNASDLFPAVVKNVVSKNVEIKKLVYVYLMRYAEEQQDLALLSISTFQRALKDPNQLIRASALRVLSSIRVPIIVTIMLLAIKEAVGDMSPYVRKTAANAITKLYSLDPELKEDLVAIIEKLLADKTILVAGSAIQAFEEVCPERIDLIHKNYRKLCNLLIDVDEWGQVIIINMLTRYARTQFTNPHTASDSNTNFNKLEENKEDEEEEDPENEDFDAKFNLDGRSKVLMDPDHRLLLRVTRPLLQSRNSAVVMAVAQLYYYVAPKSEVQYITKALVRLLRSHREVQIIVLKNIVSMAQKNPQLFQLHQKSFYVHSNDSIQIKILKLEILTCLANETNISVILREFQAYVLSQDKEFAAATIHAIGRCASSIKEVADNCLTGLVNLMSRKDETIVAESVVVIKRLLQLNPSKNGHIITKMAKMTDKVTVPMARASIIWLIGEYSDRVSKIAPDVLRKTAKTFCDEENIVKLQIINLAVKLYLTNQKQVALLVQYIFNLAKYDQNYDIRDRSRFLRTLLFNNEKCPNLSKHLKKILLAPKPAPVLQSIYKDSDQFQLGTLSHAISSRVNGYSDLPIFPELAPDPSVRNVEVVADPAKTKAESTSKSEKKRKNEKKQSEKFYSDEEDDEDQKSISTEGADPTNDEDEDDDEEKNSSEAESKNSESESESESSEDEDEDEDEEKDSGTETKAKKKIKKETSSESESGESEEDSEEEESDSEEKSEESEEEKPKAKAAHPPPQLASKKEQMKASPVQKTKQPLAPKMISESEESSSESESESESSEEEVKKPPVTSSNDKKKSPAKTEKASNKKVIPEKTSKKEPPKAEVNLLDLDFGESSAPIDSTKSTLNVIPVSVPLLSPSFAADLANLSTSSSMTFNSQQNFVSKKEYELLNKINGNGLQIQYRFPRLQHTQSNKMTTIELIFTNFSNGDLSSLNLSNKKLQTGMTMSDFKEINVLKNATATQQIGIDFNETTQPATFELSAIYSNDPTLGGTSTTKKWSNLSITCPIGELLIPGWNITESEFNKLQAKLKGMNEINASIEDFSHAKFLSSNMNTKLLENFHMCQIPSSQQDILKYAAFTLSSKTPMLLSLFFGSNNKCQINVNCEKIVLANMFIKEIKQLLSA